MASTAVSAEPKIAARNGVFFDRDLQVEVTGAPPRAMVTLEAEAVDAAGQTWRSKNAYATDAEGRVDLARDAPIEGTYEGAHAAGPFWSMTGARRFVTTRGDATLVLRLSQGASVLAERTVAWRSPVGAAGVEVVSIRSKALTANYYRPKERDELHPAILLLGGSGGGFNTERAALLATHGFAVLDVAYFDAPGRPVHFLESQPLEYFMGALDWLETRGEVDAGAIAVMGKSYGAQLALVLASYEPRLRAVVAEAGSSFVTGTSATLPEGPYQSAWSVGGEELAFLRSGAAGIAPVNPKQILITGSGAVAVRAGGRASAAAIPVERINGHVLLLSGSADGLWESSQMADQVLERLNANGFAFEAAHRAYEDAGHNLGGGQQAYGVPNLPPKDRGQGPGGTRQGNSVAAVDAWVATLNFLNSHLRGDDGGAE